MFCSCRCRNAGDLFFHFAANENFGKEGILDVEMLCKSIVLAPIRREICSFSLHFASMVRRNGMMVTLLALLSVVLLLLSSCSSPGIGITFADAANSKGKGKGHNNSNKNNNNNNNKKIQGGPKKDKHGKDKKLSAPKVQKLQKVIKEDESMFSSVISLETTRMNLQLLDLHQEKRSNRYSFGFLSNAKASAAQVKMWNKETVVSRSTSLFVDEYLNYNQQAVVHVDVSLVARLRDAVFLLQEAKPGTTLVFELEHPADVLLAHSLGQLGGHAEAPQLFHAAAMGQIATYRKCSGRDPRLHCEKAYPIEAGMYSKVFQRLFVVQELVAPGVMIDIRQAKKRRQGDAGTGVNNVGRRGLQAIRALSISSSNSSSNSSTIPPLHMLPATRHILSTFYRVENIAFLDKLSTNLGRESKDSGTWWLPRDDKTAVSVSIGNFDCQLWEACEYTPGVSNGQAAALQLDKPKKKDLDICAVTTYFNPAGFSNKIINFRRFVADLGNIHLLVVALAYGNSPHEVNAFDADEVHFLRTEESNRIFQKENLINIGIKRLPAFCKKVVWVDADVTFVNPNWVQDTSKKLDSFDIVQPFSIGVRLPQSVARIDLYEYAVSGLCIILSKVGGTDVMHSTGFGINYNEEEAKCQYYKRGHPGYVWSATRAYLDAVGGLYAGSPHENNDSFFVSAIFPCKAKHVIAAQASTTSKATLAHHKKYVERTQKLKPKIGYVDGIVYHVWHGLVANRDYPTGKYQPPASLHTLLYKHNFDPEKDVQLNKDGLAEWSSDKKVLHDAFFTYFEKRLEEETYLPSLTPPIACNLRGVMQGKSSRNLDDLVSVALSRIPGIELTEYNASALSAKHPNTQWTKQAANKAVDVVTLYVESERSISHDAAGKKAMDIVRETDKAGLIKYWPGMSPAHRVSAAGVTFTVDVMEINQVVTSNFTARNCFAYLQADPLQDDGLENLSISITTLQSKCSELHVYSMRPTNVSSTSGYDAILVPPSDVSSWLNRCPLPDIVVLGVQKSGTTTFAVSLRELTNAVSSKGVPGMGEYSKKEVSYYTEFREKKDPQWYASLYAPKMNNYGIDATPEYICFDDIPQRVIKTYEAFKGCAIPHFVIIVRDPVDRFRSFYDHAKRNDGKEGEGLEEIMGKYSREIHQPKRNLTFESVVKFEMTNPLMANPKHYCKTPLLRGMYAKQLAPWLQKFQPSQFSIITNIDLEQDFCNTMKFVVQRAGGLGVVFPGETPEDNLMEYVAGNRKPWLCEKLRRNGPKSAVNKHYNSAAKAGGKSTEVTEELRAQLTAHYKEANVEFADLVEKVFVPNGAARPSILKEIRYWNNAASS